MSFRRTRRTALSAVDENMSTADAGLSAAATSSADAGPSAASPWSTARTNFAAIRALYGEAVTARLPEPKPLPDNAAWSEKERDEFLKLWQALLEAHASPDGAAAALERARSAAIGMHVLSGMLHHRHTSPPESRLPHTPPRPGARTAAQYDFTSGKKAVRIPNPCPSFYQ